MKICLFVVGKTNHNYLSPGIEDYSRRVNRYVPFAIQYIAECKKHPQSDASPTKGCRGTESARRLRAVGLRCAARRARQRNEIYGIFSIY